MQRLSTASAGARQLRQEVHFACPVCGNPILTYHHFDPPWKEHEHNNLAGMIALCPMCHNEAEGGRWTKSELHELKRNAPLQSTIKKDFSWRIEATQKIIYRLGGNYSISDSTIIGLNGRPLLREGRSPDGLTLFSLDVLSAGDDIQLQICQNSLSVEALDMWDVHLTADTNHIVVRPRKGEIALDLRLRRMTPEALASMLERDLSTTKDHLPKEIMDRLTPLGFDISAMTSAHSAKLLDRAMEYAKRESLDSDGNLVLIDVENATLHSGGRKLVVRDGMRSDGASFVGSFSFGGRAFDF